MGVGRAASEIVALTGASHWQSEFGIFSLSTEIPAGQVFFLSFFCFFSFYLFNVPGPLPPKARLIVKSQKKTQDPPPPSQFSCDFLSHPHAKQLKGQETFKERGTCFDHLIILVGRHSDEFGFGEQVRPKCTVWKFQDVIGSHDMKSGLVFVHGVQYSLQGRGGGRRDTQQKGV